MTASSKTGPSQDHDTSLRVLYWNAGDLNNSKFLQFKRNVIEFDADVYFTVEAGASTENIEFFRISNYINYVLPRCLWNSSWGKK